MRLNRATRQEINNQIVVRENDPLRAPGSSAVVEDGRGHIVEATIIGYPRRTADDLLGYKLPSSLSHIDNAIAQSGRQLLHNLNEVLIDQQETRFTVSKRRDMFGGRPPGIAGHRETTRPQYRVVSFIVGVGIQREHCDAIA